MNDNIVRVFQYPDKPHHVTLVVATPEKYRQFDIPVNTPMGKYYKERMK